MNRRHKILIVDDNAANLTTCKTILKESYDVYTALSAASMLSLLKNIKPDLILLDVKMPEINGYDAARLLKNDPLYKDIPIIFVSTLSDVESEMEGLELGALDYISKPYFPPILIKRIKTHLDLIDKTDELEKASQAKTNFLANMSHEMRTPLTAVLGLTELMLNTVHYDEETRTNLIKIHNSGETLLNLINDILDVSKIEVDRFALHPAEYNLTDLLGDTINQSLQYNTDSKPIRFILDIPDNLPTRLYGDELRIKQILNNLMSNAFKFTQEGTIELGVRHETDKETILLTFWVRDTGIGIRPEDIDKLFTTYPKMEDETFHRNENRRTQGTGLGLFISKTIADMMHGSITVSSVYGEGSCFTVKIKQKCVSADVLDIETTKNLRELHFVSRGLKDADKPRINMSYAKVLVVDDNNTNLDVAKGLIGLYGIKVDCATSGRQAVDAVLKADPQYDAIFLDHLMPDMNGIETLRVIREEINTPYAKTVPVIALTANAITGNEEIFMRSGFQAYISKPIEQSSLDCVLRQWVRDKYKESLLLEKTISVSKKPIKNRLLNESIPGVDINKGISRFNNNEDVYIDNLLSYAENTRLLLERIRDVSADNLGDYAIIIHGIKGSGFGICADTVGNEAQLLEDAAKSEDFQYISSNNQRFIDTVLQLIENIEAVCTKIGAMQKPVKDKPDEALLAGLLSALETIDIDEMDAVMEEIDKYRYTADDGLAQWLSTSLKQGKYNDIKKRLTY